MNIYNKILNKILYFTEIIKFLSLCMVGWSAVALVKSIKKITIVTIQLYINIIFI